MKTCLERSRSISFYATSVLVLVAALRCGAQPAERTAVTPPAPKDQVYITLSGVTLHALVLYVSDFTGKPVLLPDRFPGDKQVDVVSASKAAMPRSKAIEIIASALRSSGFSMIEKADYVQVVPEGQIEGVPVRSEVPDSGLGAQSLMTTLIDVKNADASKLVPILNSLRSKAGNVQVYPDSNKLVITEQGGQLKAMLDLVRSLDTRWAANVSEVVRLQKSSVDTLQPVVAAYLRNMTQNAEPLVQKRLQSFTIYGHLPTNSFVLFGHPEDMAKIKELIRTLDVAPVDAARTYHTYFPLNRDAMEMRNVLNEMFAAAKARAGAEAPPAVIADQVNGAIIMVTTADKYAEILPIIQTLDKPKAQVQIEAALIEVSLDKLLDLGVELATVDKPGSNARGFAGTTFNMSTISTDGRTPSLPATGGLTAGIWKGSAMNIPALLRLAQNDENVSFIAAPRLMASDNKTATVTIGEKREYQRSVISPEGTTTAVTQGGFNEAMIQLDFTPHVNEEGTVRLEIALTVQQFLSASGTSANPLTNLSSRSAKTEVIVPDGHTVVIAGLTRTGEVKTVSKVPILGSLPVLGFFFRHTTTATQQLNLCVFITPHIFRTKEALAAEAAKRREEMKEISRPGESPLPEKTLDTVTGAPPASQQAPAPSTPLRTGPSPKP